MKTQFEGLSLDQSDSLIESLDDFGRRLLASDPKAISHISEAHVAGWTVAKKNICFDFYGKWGGRFSVLIPRADGSLPTGAEIFAAYNRVKV
jgi:hypothetical protein